MHNSGDAIKAALSIRLYSLNKNTNSFDDDSAFDPTNSKISINTLRTGDADLRFYITTVQDG